MTGFDADAYQARFDTLAAQGVDVHGEVEMVMGFGPRTVLDAGCGTGRVAVECARRGAEVVGVDVDGSMLRVARQRGPDVTWIEADLADMELSRTFDAVVLAGNVPLFCPPGSRASLVRSCGAHVAPDGVLVAGFQLDRGYGLDEWDRACAHAGLRTVGRWSTWDRQPFEEGGGYVVSAHQPAGASETKAWHASGAP